MTDPNLIQAIESVQKAIETGFIVLSLGFLAVVLVLWGTRNG